MNWYGKALLLWAASPLVLMVYIFIALAWDSLRRRRSDGEAKKADGITGKVDSIQERPVHDWAGSGEVLPANRSGSNQ